jgi:hypothetical protein
MTNAARAVLGWLEGRRARRVTGVRTGSAVRSADARDAVGAPEPIGQISTHSTDEEELAERQSGERGQPCRRATAEGSRQRESGRGRRR